MKSLCIFGLVLVVICGRSSSCTADEVDAEVRKAIQIVLNRHAEFSRSIRNRDGATVYDYQEATAKVLRKSGYELAGNQRQFLTMAMRSCFADRSDHMNWRESKLTASRIRLFDDGRRAEASVQFQNETWTSLGVFWLNQADGKWRIYDFCYLRDGVSLCEAKALEMTNVLCGDQEMSTAAQGLLGLIEKRRSGVQGGNGLRKKRGFRFPISAEAIRWRLQSIIELEKETRIDRIVEYTDKFFALEPDHPLVDQIKAMRYSRLEKPKPALQYAEKSLEQFGQNAKTLLIKADALRRLNRGEEAIALLKKGLRAFPRNERCLFELVRLLPESRANELLPFFDAEYSAANSFQSLVDQCVELKHPKTLSVLLGEFRKLEPSREIAKYYDGVLLGLQGKHVEAAATMKSFLDSLDLTVREEYWMEIAGYYGQLIASGKILDEYEKAERSYDFVLELLDHDSLDPMHRSAVKELVDAFLKDNADDPHAHELAGYYFFNHKQYREADKAYAAAMRLAPDGDAWQMRVWVNPELGAHGEFLEEIRERDEIVQQWFENLLLDKRFFDVVSECLDLYERGDHNESVLKAIHAKLAFEKGDFDQTIAQISSLNKSEVEPDVWELLVRAFIKKKDYDRALYFTKYLEDYESAMLRALVYALKGDLERFDQVVAEKKRNSKYFRAYLVTDPYFPDGFAGIAKESKFKQRRMVALLKAPANLTSQEIDRAIQKVWGVRLTQREFGKLADSDRDFIAELHKNRFLVDAKGYRFFVQSNPYPFLHRKQGYVDELRTWRKEKAQNQTPEKIERLNQREAAIEAHRATVGVDVISWPITESRLGAPQPRNAPRDAEKMVSGLVAELAGSNATGLLNVDKMRIRVWSDELFQKLTSSKRKPRN